MSHSENLRSRLIVIQATKFCNIDCSYCYLPDRNSKRTFPLDGYSRLVRQIVDAGLTDLPLRVCWHAGEPLTLPAEYFDEAIKQILPYQDFFPELRFSVQTNATCVTADHCALFRKYNFAVGVSLDGPAHVHDKRRLYRSGEGSHAKAERGLRLIQATVGKVSTISVIDVDSSPEEIIEYFADLGVPYIAFNLDELDGSRRASDGYPRNRKAGVRDFLTRAFIHNAKLGFPLEIRELEGLQLLLDDGAPIDRSVNIPLRIISVDAEGGVSTFCPELISFPAKTRHKTIYGNIFSSEIRSIFEGTAFRSAASEVKEGVELCRRSCEFFRFCGGGCPSNKLAESGTFAVDRTEYCEIYEQGIVEARIAFLEKLPESTKPSRIPSYT